MVEARRAFVQELRDHPLVDKVDFTRDGFQTVILTLDDSTDEELEECPVCGAVGLPERIEDHDCQTFLTADEEAGRDA